jgi:hypothetical protein
MHKKQRLTQFGENPIPIRHFSKLLFITKSIRKQDVLYDSLRSSFWDIVLPTVTPISVTVVLQDVIAFLE